VEASTTRVAELYERCQWYELALMRHGFTVERLQRLARKVANDELRLRGAVLGDRFEDLVSRVQIVGLQAALRYDPQHEQHSYGRNGGHAFQSYVCDLMAKRVTDFYRSRGEGLEFGDRRKGHHNRIVLGANEDLDVGDLDDFDELVDERRRERWQQAAAATEWPLEEWIVVTLDLAARAVLGRNGTRETAGAAAGG
jgi:hypothetical protein